MRHFPAYFSLPAILAFASVVHAAEVTEYLHAAILDGEAKGIVTGSVAETVSATTGSTDLLIAVIKSVGAFTDRGCKRLQVSLLKKSAKSAQGPPVDLTLPSFELNMCLDGKPPVETLAPQTQKELRAAALKSLSQILSPAGRPGK